MVVGLSPTWRPAWSTPFSSSTPRRYAPKPSLPTLPMKAVLQPSRAAATATLAGAPPGLAANTGTCC